MDNSLPVPAALHDALKRLSDGQASEADQQRLRAALEAGLISFTNGDHIQTGDIQQAQFVVVGKDIQANYINLTPDAIQHLQRLFAPPPAKIPALPDLHTLPDPGPLPPGSRLTFPRNALFTGRQPDLLALAQAGFYPASGPAALIQSITGLGGIGKTQLAVEFAYRYGRFTHAVHWINAAGDINAEIAACGLAMNLLPWPDKTPEQVACTLDAWQRQPDRLALLDNLEDPDLLQEWLPRLSGLRLLITSRRTDLPGYLGIHGLPLQTFPRPESLAFLRTLAPRLSAVPDAALDPVAARLGDLPLALHLAGSYLALQRSRAPADYLAELDKAGGPLRHHPPSLSYTKSPTKHDLDLYATFQLSWQLLDPADPIDQTAQRLFLACCYCAPNTPIPLDLLAACLPSPGGRVLSPGRGAGGEGEIDLPLHRLTSLGLLETAAQGAAIHPLLAEFARLQDAALVGAQGLAPLPALADALLDLAYAANMSGLPANVAPYRMHLAAAADFQRPGDLAKTATLLTNLGYYLDMSGDLPAARLYYVQALAINREVLGEHHPDTASSLNNLGMLLKDIGDLPAARPYLEQALAINREILGERHSNTATSLNNLGLLLKDLGDLPAARKYYEQALAIWKEVLGERHPNTASSLNNLGSLLQALGDLPAARPYYEQALAIRREVLGEHHPDTATSFDNLGLLLQDLGDLSAARLYLEQALAIRREALGERHPDTAGSFNNLGLLLKTQGNLLAARKYYEQALAINQEALGERHPDTATSLNNLGSLLYAQGDLSAARPYFEQAIAIRKEALGEHHPATAVSLSWLGVLERDLGQPAMAHAYFEQALSIFQAALPPDHPHIRILQGYLRNLKS